MSHPHVEVVYRLDSRGKPHPLQFYWDGRLHEIEDIGREWEEELEWHMLVRAANERVCELIYNPVLHEWFMKTLPQPPQMV